MKVLYDISVLGLGSINASARTGIFRVVENIAEQLVLKNDCKLKFSSISGFNVLKHTIDYLEHKPELKNISLSIPQLYKEGNAFQQRQDLIDVVLHTKMSAVEKLKAKFKIRSLWAKEKFFSNFSDGNSYLNHEDLSETDVFHSTFFPIPDYIKKKHKKSIFLTCYDLIPILYPQYSVAGIRDTLHEVVKSVDRDTWVLCISHATRNDLLNYKGKEIDPDKVLVTELAASDNFYRSEDAEKSKEVRSKYSIPEAPYILSVCTLEPRKNIESVIKAFVKVIQQEKIQDLNLVLAGAKGWMFDKIFEELDASASVRSRIIITGYVADEHLAPLYSDALLFIYPSFYEGFGLPPLEAMQCGTPVITSNTSSLPEVVGDAGLMVAPADTNALCEAILTIYRQPQLRAQMIEKSLSRAKHFSWERCAQETVNAYKASLNFK